MQTIINIVLLFILVILVLTFPDFFSEIVHWVFDNFFPFMQGIFDPSNWPSV